MCCLITIIWCISQQEGYHSPFEGMNGALLLTGVTNQGILDVAFELIKGHPDIGRTKHKDVDTPLMTIAGKLDLYYIGMRYNFYQRFVYSYVPMDNIFGDTDKVRDIENQEIYKDKVVSRCSLRTGLLSTLQIKRLKEDKVKHKEALTLLRHICEEVGKTNKYNDMGEHYFEATNAAAVNDTPEAIEEMVMHCPQAIWSNTNDYYIIQSAILNRTEKVYNLLVHEMNINMFFHKVMKDKDGNNLLHLAAQLAPIHKLNVVSGAALQMQRELQWFLLMLFLSVTSLMVAFSAALYIVSGQENNWILIPIAALTCLPVASFVTLQFPLLVELISSTYGRGIFGKQNDNTKARTWFVMFLCVGFGL